ncbi:hypothetical protein Dimus_022901, partial [Dionaea muscipula]
CGHHGGLGRIRGRRWLLAVLPRLGCGCAPIHVGCARVAGTSSGTPPMCWSLMLCVADIVGCLGLGCRVLLPAATAHSGGRLLDPPWKSAA